MPCIGSYKVSFPRPPRLTLVGAGKRESKNRFSFLTASRSMPAKHFLIN